MKKIFFLRHAKSSWSDFSLKDFDRPLSTRGIQDAELMGNYFQTKKINLDVVISSPSKRTKEEREGKKKRNLRTSYLISTLFSLFII